MPPNLKFNAASLLQDLDDLGDDVIHVVGCEGEGAAAITSPSLNDATQQPTGGPSSAAAETHEEERATPAPAGGLQPELPTPHEEVASAWDNVLDIEQDIRYNDPVPSLSPHHEQHPALQEHPDPNDESWSSSSAAMLSNAILAGSKQRSGGDPSSARSIRTYIRRQSSGLKNKSERYIDERRLTNAVKDAGQYAYGIAAVEVWVLEDQGHLIRPNGGWWHSQDLLASSSNALSSLEAAGSGVDGGVDAALPGVGLAGTLWREAGAVAGYRSARSINNLHQHQQSTATSNTIGSRVAKLGSRANSSDRLFDEWQQHRDALQWRDIDSLLMDPDTAQDERLALYRDSGFQRAAAVPFHSWEYKGIVLYLTTEPEQEDDDEGLAVIENEVYMVTSASIIGSIIASTDARRACCLMKKKAKKLNNLEESSHEDRGDDDRDAELTLSSGADETDKAGNAKPSSTCTSPARQDQSPCGRSCRWIGWRVWNWAKKCRGGDAQIPPAQVPRETIYTWIGVFCALLMLSAMNEFIQKFSDDQYELLIGPFGALMTLQYGLTAAPASQPRNAVLGQAVAGAISMSFTYIPTYILPTWIRRAVGPAFAVSAMTILGIPHPPAGAHSVIYASGNYGWMFYFFVVLASMISVLPATLVNNMSDKRQYPTFWGPLLSRLWKRGNQMCQSEKKQVSHQEK